MNDQRTGHQISQFSFNEVDHVFAYPDDVDVIHEIKEDLMNIIPNNQTHMIPFDMDI